MDRRIGWDSALRRAFGRVSSAGHSGPHLHSYILSTPAFQKSKNREHHVAITYPMNVSASKLEVWSRLSNGSSGMESASVDATFDSDIGGAAIYDMVIVSKPSMVEKLALSKLEISCCRVFPACD